MMNSMLLESFKQACQDAKTRLEIFIPLKVTALKDPNLKLKLTEFE